MKRKIKGLVLAACMLLGVAALTGCSSAQAQDEVTTLTADEVNSYKTSASQTIQTVAAFTDEDIEQYLVQNTNAFVTSTVESWKSAKEELGAFKEIKDQVIKEDGTQITITSTVEFEKASASVPLIMDKTQGAVSMSFDVVYTMAQTMERAGLNTIMGIGIVFLMLIFLSFLISQFKHFAKLEAKFSKKEDAVVTAPAIEQAVTSLPEAEEELVDDGELVAVIAAAIAASENTSTDSFVVRSIKKSNARKWKRA